MYNMNKTHQKILKAIFDNPVNGAMEWSDIESLLIAVGCQVIEGKGSSVTFEKEGMKVFFHRPHPQKEALRYRVKDARLFLQKIGIQP
jgi:hypothetical protein